MSDGEAAVDARVDDGVLVRVVDRQGVDGRPATLRVALNSYLVGDSSPLLSDLNSDLDRNDALEFGDGVLTVVDLIDALLRSVNQLSPPAPCGTDRFDAMDANSSRTVEVADLVITLLRITLFDTSRPTRTAPAPTAGCPP